MLLTMNNFENKTKSTIINRFLNNFIIVTVSKVFSKKLTIEPV